MPVGEDKTKMVEFVKKLHENGKDELKFRVVGDVTVYRGTPQWSNEADPSKRGDTNNV